MRKAYFKEWYGGSCESVIEYIEFFNKIIDENVDKEKAKEVFSLKPKALISPHAGWMYSGFSANFAYKIAQNSKDCDRVVVIGPSHKFAFNGISTTLEDKYETPCGELEIDINFAKELMSRFYVENLEYVHSEHSTEVQMPFIKYYIDKPVVELIYSNYQPDYLKEIIKFSLDSNSLVVISSDLSHYYDLKTANYLDSHCLEAVQHLDINYLEKCEACGKIGIHAMILAAIEKNLTPFIVDYRTSADITHDESKVVGYMSAIFI